MNQWLLEVLPGVFVGRISARVRDYLWQALSHALLVEDGSYASLIRQSDDNEQGFVFETVGTHPYEPKDIDGLWLVIQHHHERAQWDPLDGLPNPTW